MGLTYFRIYNSIRNYKLLTGFIRSRSDTESLLPSEIHFFLIL